MLLVAYCSFLFMCTKVGTHKKERLLFRKYKQEICFYAFVMRITISGPVLFSRLCRFGVCVVCGTGSFLVPCFDFSPSLYECSGFIFLAPPPDFYTAAAKKRLECVTIHKPWQHEGTSSGCIEKYPFVCMYRCKSFLSGYLCSHLA